MRSCARCGRTDAEVRLYEVWAVSARLLCVTCFAGLVGLGMVRYRACGCGSPRYSEDATCPRCDAPAALEGAVA